MAEKLYRSKALRISPEGQENPLKPQEDFCWAAVDVHIRGPGGEKKNVVALVTVFSDAAQEEERIFGAYDLETFIPAENSENLIAAWRKSGIIPDAVRIRNHRYWSIIKGDEASFEEAIEAYRQEFEDQELQELVLAV